MNSKRVIAIKEIVNVLPYRFYPDDMGEVTEDGILGVLEATNSEDDGEYTAIECIINNEDGEDEEVLLLLSRGEDPCKNTYLLADAIRGE